MAVAQAAHRLDLNAGRSDRLEVGPNEQNARDAVIRIARGWIGTPYLPRECRRGRGCDCGTLLIGIYREAGLVGPLNLGDYDWLGPWAKRGADRLYVGTILDHLAEISEQKAKPGDVVLYHIGRGWSHAALIITWPAMVVHALRNEGVVASDGRSGQLFGREMRFFSPWGQRAQMVDSTTDQ